MSAIKLPALAVASMLLAVPLAAQVASQVASQVPGTAAPANSAVASALAGPPAPYVSPDTPQGGGPYPAIMQTAPGLPSHTLYRPVSLEALGHIKLPVVVWGNGACINAGNRFRYFLTEIASHGFLVLALGPIGPSEGEHASSGSAIARPAPWVGSSAAKALAAGQTLGSNLAGGSRPSDTSAQQMIDAIDWAQALAQQGGALGERVDPQAIAVMGQSCGGLQATAAAMDPRVKTLGVWNSGLFDDDSRQWAIADAKVTKADLKGLKASAIYVTGDPSDVAFKNGEDDFARVDQVPVFRAWREDTGHSGTYREYRGGAFAPVAVAWLQWQLKRDAQAARLFVGPRCGLCDDPRWHVKKKRIDP